MWGASQRKKSLATLDSMQRPTLLTCQVPHVQTVEKIVEVPCPAASDPQIRVTCIMASIKESLQKQAGHMQCVMCAVPDGAIFFARTNISVSADISPPDEHRQLAAQAARSRRCMSKR